MPAYFRQAGTPWRPTGLSLTHTGSVLEPQRSMAARIFAPGSYFLACLRGILVSFCADVYYSILRRSTFAWCRQGSQYPINKPKTPPPKIRCVRWIPPSVTPTAATLLPHGQAFRAVCKITDGMRGYGRECFRGWFGRCGHAPTVSQYEKRSRKVRCGQKGRRSILLRRRAFACSRLVVAVL